MAQFTLDFLQRRKEKLEKELRELGNGVSGYQRASLHDDRALEERRNTIRGALALVGALDRVRVIQPGRDTDKVGLGNKVSVEYTSGETETFTLLGEDDVKFGDRSNVVSHKSPVGLALLGKREGETVICKLPDKRKIQLKIKEIKPGDF